MEITPASESYKEKKRKLEEKIEREILLSDPDRPGRFIKSTRDDGTDQQGHLHPNNWVFHDQIVEKVIEGDYLGIMPYSGEFVTTANCTNRCESPCPFQPAKEIMGVWEKNDFSNPAAHMQDVGYAIELSDKLIEGGLKGLIFTGGGEPFLFKDLEKVISHVTDNGVDAVLYTNGNAVSEERVMRTIEADPLLVRVSLNAGTEEAYNRFSRPLNPDGALERALITIENFAKGSVKKKDMSVGVSVVVHKTNRYDLIEAAQRIAEIVDRTGGGIDFIAYRPAFNYWSEDQLAKELLKETYLIVEEQVRPILEGSGVSVSNIKTRYEALQRDTRHYDSCRASGLYVELSPSGKLHLCCDRNCHSDYVIGDLNDKSLEEAWNGERRIDMIKQQEYTRCKMCPPACKPHLTNNQFAAIEKLRHDGELYKAEIWIDEQRKMPMPKMVNF